MLLGLIAGVSLLCLVSAQLHPGPAQYRPLPSLREQAQIQDAWRQERIDAIPSLLRKYNVDGWFMSQREHAEDPIWWSIKRATEFAPHRRTIVFFHTNTSSLAGQPNPLIYVDNTVSVFQEIRQMLRFYKAERIAVNVDPDIAHASGMHYAERQVLELYVGRRYTHLFVNEPMLAVEFVSRRVPGHLEVYRHLQEIVWAMAEEGFSERVITPGVTSTDDLQWWFRDKMLEQNVSTWNHPRVSVVTPETFPGWTGSNDIIREGDVLHIDFGITAMGLNTDMQHMAYVLRTSQNETTVPEGLVNGMMTANRLQEIMLEKMKPGMTGNQVLEAVNTQMYNEGLRGQFFSHPIGDWGHAPGAVIGFNNMWRWVPIIGDLHILPDTFYSLELFGLHYVPERRELLRFMLEENVFWNATSEMFEFVRGRQEHFHIVNASSKITLDKHMIKQDEMGSQVILQ